MRNCQTNIFKKLPKTSKMELAHHVIMTVSFLLLRLPSSSKFITLQFIQKPHLQIHGKFPRRKKKQKQKQEQFILEEFLRKHEDQFLGRFVNESREEVFSKLLESSRQNSWENSRRNGWRNFEEDSLKWIIEDVMQETLWESPE